MGRPVDGASPARDERLLTKPVGAAVRRSSGMWRPEILVAVWAIGAVPVLAQWSGVHTPGIPRTNDGKPELAAKAPRTPDGQPDLSGLWSIRTEDYWYDIGTDLKPGGVPMLPAAAAVYKERSDNFGKDNPIARCMPAGVPTIDIIPTPFRIIESGAEIAILYEYNMEYRQIFTDDRVLPRDANPNWMGYSKGHWEGDTLVVETDGLKDNTWLDLYGHPATDALHVTERFRRIDVGNIDLEVTLTDPKSYTHPWRLSLHPKLMADTELLEFVCIENNPDVRHLVGK